MKKIKFLSLALILVLGVLTTSCLNSSNSSQDGGVGGGMVKVYESYNSTSGIVMQSSDGYMIYPTAQSVASLSAQGKNLSQLVGKVVYALYSVEAIGVDENTKVLSDVTLINYYELNEKLNVIDATRAEALLNPDVYGNVEGNAAIISMTVGEDKPVLMFDQYTLMLPINHWMKKTENELTLNYFKNDIEEQGVLTLYLSYNEGSTNSSSATYTSLELYGYGYRGLYTYFYDLTPILLQMPLDGDIEKIRVVAMKNESGLISGAEEVVYEVNY